MRVIPFQIPKNSEEAFRVQVDKMPVFYPHLHQHPELQLTLIVQSEGTLIAGDYIGRFQSGDIFLIGANQPHVLRNDDTVHPETNAHSITVFFDEETLGRDFWLVPELKALQSFWKNSGSGYRIKSDKNSPLANKIRQLPGASGIDRLVLFVEILKCLTVKKDIVPLASVVLNKNIKSYDGARLNKVLAFSFESLHRPVKLSEAAAVADLSQEAFCRYFKTRTRKTYTNFLQEIRISHACKLLGQTTDSIASVSIDCGFQNLSHFNRVFKKIKGLSPGEYRRGS
ncbi:MAG: helix-turn-helix transcriptional regulator [Gemmatimonadaceae bacterium]|nr:helix-turn-helix transcriptional regulator [Chitinophagaceae bacterium]